VEDTLISAYFDALSDAVAMGLAMTLFVRPAT
jgi:hypothetical protein